MTVHNTQLSQIIEELEIHVERSCTDDDLGKTSDFSGENCNDAFLMLQDAQQVQSNRGQD